MNVKQKAYRNDSAPYVGANISLRNPIVNGPNPNPIKFKKKNNTADANARILALTRLCVTAILGPK